MTHMLKRLFLNDKAVFAVILLNSLMIFLQESGIDSIAVNSIDALCTIFFILEMAVKHHEWGIKGYWKSGWNRLDGILVLLSLPSIVTYIVPSIGLNTSFLLTLRLLRVFRFFRMLHLFPEFPRIMQNVRLAIRDSLSIFVGIVILIIIVSIVNCALFGDIAPQYFRSPLDSMYAVFQICTVEGWYEIPNSICANAAPWAVHFIRLYFIIILVTLGLIGLSIVNSIFVDAMVQDNNDDVLQHLDKISKDLEDLRSKLTTEEK